MLKIWTDGSCLGNPGPGGWAFVATDGKNIAHRSGGERDTTNNRMELMAVIRALTAAHRHSEIEIHTDSQYVKNGITQWIHSWKAKGWKTADKKPVKNQELWVQLDELNSALDVTWNWVKGHAGIEYNELCDQLCQREIRKFKS